jgi:tetratricopeptide (TPR) repeat protein
VADNPRIEELRRRIQKDPASIAFAQLAEEYRRAGSYEDAIATCRAGLAIHPSYLSARVTLGRALIEMNELEAAETELQFVRHHAAENIAAIRGLAEIHHRRGELGEALSFYKSALGLARHDPDLEQTVDEISRTMKPVRAPATGGLSFEQASAEFQSTSHAATTPQSRFQPRNNPALPGLERFLEAIHTYRHRRAG